MKSTKLEVTIFITTALKESFDDQLRQECANRRPLHVFIQIMVLSESVKRTKSKQHMWDVVGMLCTACGG